MDRTLTLFCSPHEFSEWFLIFGGRTGNNVGSDIRTVYNGMGDLCGDASFTAVPDIPVGRYYAALGQAGNNLILSGGKKNWNDFPGQGTYVSSAMLSPQASIFH